MNWRESKYLRFVQGPAGEKTQIWAVIGSVPLGYIKWYGRWRGYAFYPNADTLFNPTCLAEIAEFCEEKTKAHMADAKARRANDRAVGWGSAGH